MRAIGVAPERTATAWPIVAHWISAALERGKGNTSSNEVRDALHSGLMQLWIAWSQTHAKGCCVTEIIDSARGKTCNLIVVAGLDLAQWLPLTEHIKDWARSHGCVRLEASGRAGWERRVRQDGWRKIRTTIEMEL